MIDQDGNVFEEDSKSVIRVIQMNEKDKVYGTSTSVFNKGVAKFEDIIFESEPGSKNVSFQVVTNAFNEEKMRIVSKGKFQKLILNFDF